MAPHSSTPAWKIPWTEEHGRLHAVHRVAKRQARLSDFTFTFHFHALEKEMAAHSSVPAWRIPGTAGPGGLPSMGSVPQSQTRLKRLSSSSIHVCTSEATLVLLPAALASRGAAVLQSPWPAPTDDAGPRLCCATALQGTPLPPRRLSDSRAGGWLPGAGLESRRTSHTHTDYHTVLQKASLVYLYQLHIGSAYQTCLSSLKTL